MREVRIPRRKPVPPPPDPVESDESYIVIMDCWAWIEQIRKAQEAERESK